MKYVTWSGTDPASQIPDICLEGLRKPRSTLSQVERTEIWTRHRPKTKQKPSESGISWQLLYDGEVYGTEFVSHHRQQATDL
jgi:hypothetical protein